MKKKGWIILISVVAVVVVALSIILPLVLREKKYPDDWTAVKEKCVIRIGMEAGYAPYNYRQQTDENGAVPIANSKGEYANGYDVKVAKFIAEQLAVEIAKELGLETVDELEFKLEIYALEWDSLINALNANSIDAIIAGMSPTAERKESIDFSDPYYQSNLVVVVRKDGDLTQVTDLTGLKDRNIVAQRGTFHAKALEQIRKVDDTQQYDTFTDMITALNAGTIEGYIAEEPGAIADTTANTNLMYLPLKNNENGFVTTEEDTALAVGLRKNSTLTDKINAVLANLTEEQRVEFMNEAIEEQPVESIERGFFGNIWYLLRNYWLRILQGVGVTIAVSIIGTVVGLLIGLLVGFVRTLPVAKSKAGRIWQKIFNFILSAYVEIFRGTPMMVQAMVIYWGYAMLNGGVTMNTFVAGLLIVSVNTGAYITEIVRGGINSLDKGQFEGSAAIGMSHWQTMMHVIMPQTIKNILPAVSNEFVINIKDTSVLSVLVGFIDLFAVGSIMIAGTYRTFETYLIISVVYFILTFSITRLLRWLERKFNGKSSYTLYNSDIVSANAEPKGE